MVLCGDDGIAIVSLDGKRLCAAPLGGAVALCVGKEFLYCADANGVIWRFDVKTLMPRGICGAGPGICAMCLSEDERRLYALLGEADCVLMADARSGQPLAVNRCGCNPQSLALAGNLLYAAGGESGCIHLYDAHTLEGCGKIPMPGPVYSASLCTEGFYALCLTEQLSTILIAGRRKNRISVHLDGMPGCVCASGEWVYAWVHGKMYTFVRKDMNLIEAREAPGRISRAAVGEGYLAAYDLLGECVYCSCPAQPWRCIFCGAKDMAVSLS